MLDQWFVKHNGQQFGPVIFAELQQWARAKRVAATDWVQQAGSSAWMMASTVPGLFDQPGPKAGSAVEASLPTFHGGSPSLPREKSKVSARPRTTQKKLPIGWIVGSVCIVVVLVAAIGSALYTQQPSRLPTPAKRSTADNTNEDAKSNRRLLELQSGEMEMLQQIGKENSDLTALYEKGTENLDVWELRKLETLLKRDGYNGRPLEAVGDHSDFVRKVIAATRTSVTSEEIAQIRGRLSHMMEQRKSAGTATSVARFAPKLTIGNYRKLFDNITESQVQEILGISGTESAKARTQKIVTYKDGLRIIVVSYELNRGLSDKEELEWRLTSKSQTGL